MVLTPEDVAIGRRNFLKAMAGAPPLLAFGVAAALRGPIRGGPVKAGSELVVAFAGGTPTVAGESSCFPPPATCAAAAGSTIW